MREKPVMATDNDKTLADLEPGQNGIIRTVLGDANIKRRLSALGLVNGTKVSLSRAAPLGDPRAYEIFDYLLSLRNEEASHVLLQPVE
jgi:ferrous iron transport protein A